MWCHHFLFSESIHTFFYTFFYVLRKNASKYQKLKSGISRTELNNAGLAALSAKAKTTAIIEMANPFSKEGIVRHSCNASLNQVDFLMQNIFVHSLCLLIIVY